MKKAPIKFSDLKHSELAGRQVLCVLYGPRLSGLRNSDSSDAVRSKISFHWSVKSIKAATTKSFTVQGSHSMYDFDGHEKPMVQAMTQSVFSLCVMLTATEVTEMKRRWQWFKEQNNVKKVLADVSKRMTGKSLKEIGEEFHKQFSNPKPFKSKIDMNLIEAKVEAAAASRMWGRHVYIVKKDEHPDKPMKPSYDGEAEYFHVLDNAPAKYETYYFLGAEKGEGVNVGAQKMTTKEPKFATFTTDDDGTVTKVKPTKEVKPKSERTKTPTVLEKVTYKSIADVIKSATTTHLGIISGKSWVVAVQSGWGLKRTLIDQCEAGLILIIKGQGYYTYDKKMWKEFDGIFASKSYSEGGNYVQSKLPAKFEQYFKKF